MSLEQIEETLNYGIVLLEPNFNIYYSYDDYSSIEGSLKALIRGQHWGISLSLAIYQKTSLFYLRGLWIIKLNTWIIPLEEILTSVFKIL